MVRFEPRVRLEKLDPALRHETAKMSPWFPTFLSRIWFAVRTASPQFRFTAVLVRPSNACHATPCDETSLIKRSKYRRVKHFFDAVPCHGRAFDVHDRTNVFRHLPSFVFADRTLAAVREVRYDTSFRSAIVLRSNEHYRRQRAVVTNFRYPLLGYAGKGCWADDAEAHEENVCVRVAKRS